MLSLKSKDALDDLIAAAEKILAERVDLLEMIAKAESRLAESQHELSAARECVAREEFENAQREGGLAVASKGAQQSLAEAELKVKSAGLRLQGLQRRLGPIEERLLAGWAMVKKYRQDFTYARIGALIQEYDEALKGLIRLVYKARAFEGFWPKPAPHGIFHPATALAKFSIGNPFTRDVCVQGEFVIDGGRKMISRGHPERDPEALVLQDALKGMQERVMRLGVTLKEAGLSGIDLKAQEGDEPAEEEQPDDRG